MSFICYYCHQPQCYINHLEEQKWEREERYDRIRLLNEREGKGKHIQNTKNKIQDIFFLELSNNNNLFDNHKKDPIKTYKNWLDTYMTKTDKNG